MRENLSVNQLVDLSNFYAGPGVGQERWNDLYFLFIFR